MTADRTFGGVGSKVLFENERVRVWELTLQLGEDSPVHRHENNHLLIQIAGDRVAVVPEPDTHRGSETSVPSHTARSSSS